MTEYAGPFLIIAAFWQASDNTADVAHAIRSELFPGVDGYKGAVVSFRQDRGPDEFDFQRMMERLDLEEVNVRPAAASVTAA